MSFPRALSAAWADLNTPIVRISHLDTGPVSLPSKRALSGTHNGRRKQLRIDIPTTIPHGTGTSESNPDSTTVSLTTADESSSSLFSGTSPDSLFDDILSSSRLPIPETQYTSNDVAVSATLPSTAASPNHSGGPYDIREKPSPALLMGPPIPGLFFDPSLSISQEIADEVVKFCLRTYFGRSDVNQVMLFGRSTSSDSDSPTLPSATDPSTIYTTSNDEPSCPATSSVPPPSAAASTSTNTTGLPEIFLTLLTTLSTLLKPFLPEKTHTLLFPPTTTQARQAIINLYAPGEGISPHVDLLKRYGDGIIGVSLGSGCVMRFDKETHSRKIKPSASDSSTDRPNRWDLYLADRSVLVLTEDARYNWTHGIEGLARDYVAIGNDADQTSPDCEEAACGRWLERGVRISVTFRWLLAGADVVGPSDDGI